MQTLPQPTGANMLQDAYTTAIQRLREFAEEVARLWRKIDFQRQTATVQFIREGCNDRAWWPRDIKEVRAACMWRTNRAFFIERLR